MFVFEEIVDMNNLQRDLQNINCITFAFKHQRNGQECQPLCGSVHSDGQTLFTYGKGEIWRMVTCSFINYDGV